MKKSRKENKRKEDINSEGERIVHKTGGEFLRRKNENLIPSLQKGVKNSTGQKYVSELKLCKSGLIAVLRRGASSFRVVEVASEKPTARRDPRRAEIEEHKTLYKLQ